MMRSIRENGVLLPLLALATEDGYKIISGYRRMTAALRLRLEKLPVQNMTGGEGGHPGYSVPDRPDFSRKLGILYTD